MDQDLPYQGRLPPPGLRPLLGDPVPVVGDRAGGRGGHCPLRPVQGVLHNPREMAEFSPGGRYNAYAGTCGACAKVGVLADRKCLTWLLRTSDLPPVLPVNQPASTSTGGTGGKNSVRRSTLLPNLPPRIPPGQRKAPDRLI
jgi:hypothetical protein